MSLKPTNIDAQRIMAILQELKERLTLLSVVTPQVLEGLQGEEGVGVVEAMGAETFKCFCEQIRLEELYVIANTSADGTWNLENTVVNDETKDLMEKLSKNTIDLCRKLKSTNVITELRTNFQENRPQQMLQLIRQLDHMEELTLRRLSTTVEEERSRQELLEHYINREETATKKRKNNSLDSFSVSWCLVALDIRVLSLLLNQDFHTQVPIRWIPHEHVYLCNQKKKMIQGTNLKRTWVKCGAIVRRLKQAGQKY